VKRRTFVVETAGSLSDVLVREVGPSGLGALAYGAVYVDGRRARDGGVGVAPPARITVVLEESGTSPDAPVALPVLQVLHEDEDVLVVNKPAGVVAQPTPGRVGASLLDLAATHLGFPAGLVHRLDRETSGVTIFGKLQASTRTLAAAFREGTARKRYLAAVPAGLPPSGRYDLPLSKDPSRPGRWRASAHANGISALTLFECLGRTESSSLVALFPQTGRTHQLRAHLASAGFPIFGDTLYGGRDGGRCLLHAQALEIAGVLYEAPVPEDLFAQFTAAGFTPPSGPITPHT
jgi:23S rRNA pseudouridine1911/1915/1917 synthase